LAIVGAVRMMLRLASLLALAAAPALADGDYPDNRGFHRSAIYVVEGIEMKARCDCEKEVEGSFIIEVETPFENVRLASIAGLDLMAKVCENIYNSEIDQADVTVDFWADEYTPNLWSFLGSCS